MINFRLFFVRLRKIIPILSSFRFINAFLFYRVIAGVEHRPIFLKNNFETIVDIGANKGQFSIVCREWAPQARIFSFEPLKSPAKIFTDLFGKDKKVNLHKVAIGPGAKCSIMHVSAHEDSSSLLPIGPKQIALYPGTQEKGVIKIDVAPLSSFLTPEDIKFPAMLKIDVQGFEIEVLKGCDPLIDKFEYIYCECSFIELYSGQQLAYEVIDWLKQRQFNFVGIFNLSFDHSGHAIQADFLFKKVAN